MLTAAPEPVRTVARFARAREAVSAVEFALLAPVLAIMLGGAVELSGAITASNRSTFVADAVAEMVSRVDHTITETEMKNFAVTSALIDTDIIRYAKATNKDVESAFKITISSVQFKPKKLDCLLFTCKYDAEVVFSYSLNGTARSCGKLTSAPANAQTLSTLPANVFGPGSLVVVDVETFYTPTTPVRISDTISFKRSSYFRPRYLSRINYAKNCKDYQ
jgi:Flp pilus assembly protein TadG